MNTRLRTRITAPVAAAAMMTATAAFVAPATAAGEPTGGGATAAEGGDCYIHLFDGDDFDDTDDNFKLTEPGEYKDLKNLPGADEDWTDEADSAKVGSAATVTVWKDTGFSGTSKELKPGSEHASLEPEPSSLKMTCDDGGDGGDGDGGSGDGGGSGVGSLLQQLLNGLLGGQQ